MELPPKVKNILLLDSEGKRIAVKYYSDDWPTNTAKEAFEKTVFTKTQKTNARTEVEVMALEKNIIVYKFVEDLHFFVTGGEEENELILASVLQGLFDAVNLLLRGSVDKREALDNLDLIFLCIDEIIDGGIILETDANVIAGKAGINSADPNAPLSEQVFWKLLTLFLFDSERDSLSEAESILQVVPKTMVTSSSSILCNAGESDLCRNDSAAFLLKLVAIASILLAGAAGVAIPLIGRNRRFLQTDGSLFVAAKAFAAGVILATGFVHMLAGGTEALTNPCLPEFPWSKFPFPGFFAMVAALITLLVDFMGTQYYERKQEREATESDEQPGREQSPGIVVPMAAEGASIEKVFGEEDSGGIHIVGIHAHAAHHRHSHPSAHGSCDGHRKIDIGHDHDHGHGHGHGYGHGHAHGGLDVSSGARHVVVSQVLELGIVSHSIIIGISLGVSQSPCTIRPLIAALSFHQFFEGFALGGCISQAQFKNISATIMACFFALTTPIGIGIGTAVASSFNSHSVGALVTEGILDSLSAGILVYMALVDLIAADFLSKRMSCNFRLQIVSYLMLFLGAGLMSSLAIWA